MTDTLQSNVLTVAPDGTIGAEFTGTVDALGLTLPAFANGVGGAGSVNRAAWTRASDGARLADIAAGTNPPATAQQSQVFVSAESPDVAGAPTSGIAAFANATGPGATRVDVFADTASARLLSRDGASSFLQLLAGASKTLLSFGVTASVPGAVNGWGQYFTGVDTGLHNSCAFVCSPIASGVFVAGHMATQSSTGVFNLWANTSAATGSLAFAWVAIGN